MLLEASQVRIMTEIISHMPSPENLVAWVVFLASNLGLLKYQMKKIEAELQSSKKTLETNTTDVAVIKEQVQTVKHKLENGLSSQVRETAERVARIEGHCERINCSGQRNG